MTPKLTDEMREALQQQPAGPVEIPDDETQRVYVLIDAELHQRAMRALQRQEDLAAIQEGIDDLEAGRGMPIEEADSRIREKLGFPSRQ